MNLRCIEYWYRNTYYSFKPPGKVMTSPTCNHTNMGDTIWSFHYTWHLATTKLNWKASNNNKIYSYLNDEVVDESGCINVSSIYHPQNNSEASGKTISCIALFQHLSPDCSALAHEILSLSGRRQDKVLLFCRVETYYIVILEHNRYLPIPLQLVIDMCEKSW